MGRWIGEFEVEYDEVAESWAYLRDRLLRNWDDYDYDKQRVDVGTRECPLPVH